MNKPRSVELFEQKYTGKLILAAAIAGTTPWTLPILWELVQLILTVYDAVDAVNTIREYFK